MTKRTKVNNKELRNEILKSKEQGELTNRAIEILQHLVEGAINKMNYDDPRDEADCLQSGLIDVMVKWYKYEPEVSDNAFAFFTQIAKNGFNKQFNEIRKRKGLKKGQYYQEISLNQNSDQEIHSI